MTTETKITQGTWWSRGDAFARVIDVRPRVFRSGRKAVTVEVVRFEWVYADGTPEPAGHFADFPCRPVADFLAEFRPVSP